LCPNRKGEEVGRDDHQLWPSVDVEIGVREILGHGGRGEGDDQGNSEDELLHGVSPLSRPVDPSFDRLAIAPIDIG
jgi:hypothetical protein